MAAKNDDKEQSETEDEPELEPAPKAGFKPATLPDPPKPMTVEQQKSTLSKLALVDRPPKYRFTETIDLPKVESAPKLSESSKERRAYSDELLRLSTQLNDALESLVTFLDRPENAPFLRERDEHGEVVVENVRDMFKAAKVCRPNLCRIAKTLVPNIQQKIDEIVIASELGLAVNPAQMGCDLVDLTTTQPYRRFEVKKSMVYEERRTHSSRTGSVSVKPARVGFSFPVPHTRPTTHGTSKNVRMAISMEAKTFGGAAILQVVNRFNRTERTFVLQYAFLVRYFMMHQPPVQAGTAHALAAMRCWKCETFHRLEMLQEANDLYMAWYAKHLPRSELQWHTFDTSGLCWERLYAPIGAHCDLAKGYRPRFEEYLLGRSAHPSPPVYARYDQTTKFRKEAAVLRAERKEKRADTSGTSDYFDEQDEEFLEALGDEAAVAVEISELRESETDVSWWGSLMWKAYDKAKHFVLRTGDAYGDEDTGTLVEQFVTTQRDRAPDWFDTVASPPMREALLAVFDNEQYKTKPTNKEH